MSRSRVRAADRRRLEVLGAAVFLVLILLSAAMFVAPRRAWPQTPQARGSADWSGPRGPLPADVLECSQWATNATGFNPGSSPMAPSWTEP
jgi:hypothetical protein